MSLSWCTDSRVRRFLSHDGCRLACGCSDPLSPSRLMKSSWWMSLYLFAISGLSCSFLFFFQELSISMVLAITQHQAPRLGMVFITTQPPCAQGRWLGFCWSVWHRQTVLYNTPVWVPFHPVHALISGQSLKACWGGSKSRTPFIVV